MPFAHLASLPAPVLLHSADRSNRFGRYDIMSALPLHQIRWSDDNLLCDGNPLPAATGVRRPFTALQRLCEQVLPRFSHGPHPAPPFSAGFIGYMGYPLHQTLEQQIPAPQSPDQIENLRGGIYDWAIVTDHHNRTTHLYAQSAQRLAQVQELLDEDPQHYATANCSPFTLSGSKDQYTAAFARIMEYLAAGDCYQVNLTQHYQAALQGHPWALYQDWLTRQPAPFCAYLGLDDDNAILSLSPERLLRVDQGTAEVNPIKGTRPRGNTPARDRVERQLLLASTKDRAENLMIVDLLRNDLGRICDVGSIRVPNLFEAVTFSNVHHLVSTIQGQLPANVHPLTAFAALFPSGSVTGAPKIRAIDIINELEPVGRSIYCGAVGYLDHSGRFDSNVAIRTASISDGNVHVWGGGAVVVDSDPTAELAEIQHKIGRLIR